MHGRCVREGFDTVEKLALFQVENGSIPRVPVHKRWEQIKGTVESAGEYESFSAVRRRVRVANRVLQVP